MKAISLPTPLITMTLTRSEREARSMLDVFRILPFKGISPMYVTDGGSQHGNFSSVLQTLPGVKLYGDAVSGLVSQIKASITASSLHSTPYLLYMEPNKLWFAEHALEKFLIAARKIVESSHEEIGVIIPARSSASFVTYPESQRLFEARTNAALTNITELDFDFCYGPRLLATHLLDAVLELDDAFGWGWMSIPVVAAKRAGQAIHQIVLDLPCPEEERIETGNDAAYRAMQHAQHLKAVEFACSRFRMHSGRST